MKPWFSYDPDDGFELHDTEKQAKGRVEHCMDQWSDGIPDSAEDACYGRVIASAVETSRSEASEGSEFEFIAQYEIQPVKGTPCI